MQKEASRQRETQEQKVKRSCRKKNCSIFNKSFVKSKSQATTRKCLCSKSKNKKIKQIGKICVTVKFAKTKLIQKGFLFAMNTVTQKMKFRQSLIKYAEKYGVTKAAIKYNVNRQYVYRWKKTL